MIATIELAPQTLLMPVVQEMFADVASDNAWKNRALRQIIRSAVDGFIPIPTQINNGIRETPTPDSSDSTVTKIFIGSSITITSPPAVAVWSPRTGNKRQSDTPNIRYSDKLDTSIDGKFTNNLVASPIFSDVVSGKLSNSFSQDIYELVGIHLAIDIVKFP